MSDDQNIVQRMREKYGACQTYRDSGMVRSTWKYAQGPTEFETYFKAPNKFLLKLRYSPGATCSELETDALWSDGVHLRRKSTEREWNLDLTAIRHELICVSRFSFDMEEIALPMLLVKNIEPFGIFADSHDFEPVEQVELEGQLCKYLKGTRKDCHMELWVTSDGHLAKTKVNHFHPAINENIAELKRVLRHPFGRFVDSDTFRAWFAGLRRCPDDILAPFYWLDLGRYRLRDVRFFNECVFSEVQFDCPLEDEIFECRPAGEVCGT